MCLNKNVKKNNTMKLTPLVVAIYKKMQFLTSILMKSYLRLNGAKIGKNTYISISSKIIANEIRIGCDCEILSNVVIKGREIDIGNGVIVSNDVIISGRSSITIGSLSYFGKKARIDLSENVEIGRDVGFGENSVLWTHGFFPPYDEGYPVTYAPVQICDRVWISTNIVILPGVRIGRNVIIGAGAVVTKTVDDGKIIAGNPAKVLKDTESILHDLTFIQSMKHVLSGFKSDEMKKMHETDHLLTIKYTGLTVYVLERICTRIDSLFESKMNVVFVKDVELNLLEGIDNIIWFDYSSKKSKRCHYSNVVALRNYLRRYGIRYELTEKSYVESCINS